TFLDSNVVLKIVDSVKDNYKVQLSQFHSAYISKSLVTKVDSLQEKNQLSGSWKVYGDSLFDYVTVQLSQKLPYQSRMEINPSRIVVDIFGVGNNTNWLNQLSSALEIKNAWFEQPEDDVMRIIIELKHPQHWGYKIFYEKDALTVRVKRQPKILKLSNLIIAIDAGHGGSNVGTDGITTGVKEKDYTLLYAKELEKQLKLKHVKVIMTREKDTTLSMYERLTSLDQENPDILLSIHFNSSSKDSINGVSTYYRYIGFRALSQDILKSILPIGLNEFGNIGSFNFALSGPTDYPNCLIEVAFMSNRADEKKIRDPIFRKKMAEKIIIGLESFLKKI
ncbi:MAG: N-acetylmuramoyl-L-alanine amidase, partial [Ginsengibacter sp.]